MTNFVIHPFDLEFVYADTGISYGVTKQLLGKRAILTGTNLHFLYLLNKKNFQLIIYIEFFLNFVIIKYICTIKS